MAVTAPWLSVLPSLSPRGLDVEAADCLRELILSGKLGAGSHLVETVLAERLQVSRGTLRAAFRRLHDEGLVEYRPNRGVFVRQLTAEDIWEIATLRDSLETMASVLAARRIDDEGRRALRELIGEMRAAVETGDRNRAVELDYGFHRLVMRLSGHERLQQTYAVLEGQTRLFMVLTDPTHPDLSHMLPLHEPLAEAIAAGDAESAAAIAAGQNENDAQQLIARVAKTNSGLPEQPAGAVREPAPVTSQRKRG
ncbi:MAG: GntR family transcriptional regulator [Tistlia sp.]|uniref:GntR family transcriptional regulator n=1 Tax=Tistlia sp. TaxID=3057121 RepID=UPI0034A3723A